MNNKRVRLQVIALAALLPAAATAQIAGFASPTQSVGVAAHNVGVASWYGGRHDGLRTSSGETFDQDGFTAASRSLPLGSQVRVTLHETGQSVVVRVNDRMGSRRAIIDLSRGAAREIGLLGRGRGMVSIEAATGEPVEVAEAYDDDIAIQPPSLHPGRRATHRPYRTATGEHHCCHVASVMLARHLVQHHAVQHKL